MPPDPSPPLPDRSGAAAPRAWWIYVALGVAALLMFSRGGGAAPGTRIDYSELKRRAAAGELVAVEVGDERVYAQARAAPGRPGGRVFANRVRGDDDLIPILDRAGVRYSGRPDTSGLTSLLLVWVLPLGLVALFWLVMLRRLRPGAGVMAIGKTRARLVTAEDAKATFADVAGVDEAVEELREVVEFLEAPERFRRLGGKIPKGVLLVGPPGTGKTLLARAVAGEAKVPFFHLTGSDFVEMFVGVGAARVRDLFQTAQAKAPCIVFIDELDAIGKARGMGALAGHDEREQTLNQLLSEMDGFDARRGLIVVAATNRPEILDPALLRPGRFDRQVLVDRPDVRGREAILAVHVRGVKVGPDVDLRRVAALTPGLAGAELANIINEAALLTARRRKDRVGMSELDEAIERVVAGLEKKNRRMNEREKHTVAHHEAGHALLAEVLPTTDRVHKVSMIPRGLAALGYTMQLPLEDRYLMTRRELLDRLTVLMGGRAAEELVFGELSTGAQDDLQRATDLARRLVVQLGMSDVFGPQTLPDLDGQESRYLPGVRLGGGRTTSERTLETVDVEVAAILRDALERARVILERNRPQLVALAHALLEEEVLEGDRLREILAAARAPADVTPPPRGGWESSDASH